MLAAPVALPVVVLEPPEARRAGLVAAALERRHLHAVVVANGALARLVRERRRRQRRGQGRRPPRRRRQRQAVVAAQERVHGGPGDGAAAGRRRPRGLRRGPVAQLVPPGPQRRLGAAGIEQLAEDARPVDAAAHARRRDGPAQRGVLVGRPRRLRHAGPRPFTGRKGAGAAGVDERERALEVADERRDRRDFALALGPLPCVVPAPDLVVVREGRGRGDVRLTRDPGRVAAEAAARQRGPHGLEHPFLVPVRPVLGLAQEPARVGHPGRLGLVRGRRRVARAVEVGGEGAAGRRGRLLGLRRRGGRRRGVVGRGGRRRVFFSSGLGPRLLLVLQEGADGASVPRRHRGLDVAAVRERRRGRGAAAVGRRGRRRGLGGDGGPGRLARVHGVLGLVGAVRRRGGLGGRGSLGHVAVVVGLVVLLKNGISFRLEAHGDTVAGERQRALEVAEEPREGRYSARTVA